MINHLKKIESPLFTVRTQRSIHTDNEQTIQSHYLGKGLNSHLFSLTQPSLNSALDRTVKILNANPDFFAKFLKTLSSNPRVIALLQENGMTVAEFKTYLNRLKNDPSLFIDEIRSAEPKLTAYQLNTPRPAWSEHHKPIRLCHHCDCHDSGGSDYCLYRRVVHVAYLAMSEPQRGCEPDHGSGITRTVSPGLNI